MSDRTAADPVFPSSSSPSNDASNDPTLISAPLGGNHESSNDGNVDDAHQKLVMWQGIALLTADCMGVGILGLPNDMKLLGWAVGLSFLVLNCPINYYAGNLLSMLALDIEMRDGSTRVNDDDTNITEIELAPAKENAKKISSVLAGDSDQSIIRKKNCRKKKSYMGLFQNQLDETTAQIVDSKNYDEEYDIVISNDCDDNDSKNVGEENDFSEGVFEDEIIRDEVRFHKQSNTGAVFRSSADINNNHERKTSDLINITATVFSPIDSLASQIYIMLVKIVYYVNLFLVLGDYILVMSRSVAAIFGEDNICLPTAGAVASILMFGLCQFRTMAYLGRSVSLASLFALSIVLVQCLFHHHRKSTLSSTDIPQTRSLQEGDDNNEGIWGKFSSLAGIGFAVGSQKLFLNIRHELQHRDEASKVLAGSLFTYGMVYVAVVLLAGPDPPSFLFDSIPEGLGRKIAGLLLWFHVAVSYAINSQALCASLNQMLPMTYRGGSMSRWSIRSNPAARWFGITFLVSLSSYLVSNAIPFFKDLVALIGALTSVPLSLMLPAILHRRARSIVLLLPDRYCLSMDSYLLLLYSFVFLVIGLVGALSEIEEDWFSQGVPFACR